MGDSFIRRGGAWVLGQAILMTAALVLAFCFRGSISVGGMGIIGGILLVISAVVGVAGFLSLRRNLTPFPAPKQQSNLIQTGIYRVVRHPLYAAVMLAAFGCALQTRSWPGLAAAAVLVIFLNAKAAMEERWLLQKFPEYETYARRVKRFIPFLW